MDSQYKQIQDVPVDSTINLPAANPIPPVSKRKKCLKVSGLGFLICLVVTIFIATMLYYFWLPNFIQSMLNNLDLNEGETFITDPAWTSVRIVTTMTSSFSIPFPATLYTPNVWTFSFCPVNPTNFTPSFTPSNVVLPSNVALPNNWTCDWNTNSSQLGTLYIEDLHLDAGESINMVINTTLNVTNMALFKIFAGLTVESTSVIFQMSTTVDIGVTIAGISFRFDNFQLSKKITLSALMGLPGIETEFLDFISQDNVPIFNSSLRFINPSSTWLDPLGDTRFIWHNRLGESDESLVAFADTIAPNFRVELNTFSSPLAGPLTCPPMISPESRSISKLIENYVNGKNTTAITFSYSSPCCFINETHSNNISLPCTCIPSSTIPFWHAIISGLFFFINIVSQQAVHLFVELDISAATLFKEYAISGTLIMQNPFGIPLKFPEFALTLSTTVPILYLNSSFPTSIDPYSQMNFDFVRNIEVYHYPDGSTQYDAFMEFALSLQTYGSSECSVNGLIKWKLEHIPIEIEYHQIELTVTESAVRD